MVVGKELIRLRRERLVEYMVTGKGSIRKLATELGVSADCLYEDWYTRERWLTDFIGLKDVKVLCGKVVAQREMLIRECWSAVEEIRGNEAWHSYNGAVKNLREAIEGYSELLQSMGCVPKVAIAYEVDQKVETSEVKASESEVDILNQAASFLNKKDSGQARPQNLH